MRWAVGVLFLFFIIGGRSSPVVRTAETSAGRLIEPPALLSLGAARWALNAGH